MAARISRRSPAHDDLTQKLEALHLLVIEADAFHSAAEAIYDDTSWSSAARQQARNRLACLNEELRKRLDALLRESQDAIDLAMTHVS